MTSMTLCLLLAVLSVGISAYGGKFSYPCRTNADCHKLSKRFKFCGYQTFDEK